MSRASKRARIDQTASHSSAQTGIAVGHPLRLKPLGNAFFSNAPNARGRGLGMLAAFSDQQISDIFNLVLESEADSDSDSDSASKKTPVSLCRLAQVSHAVNVFAYQESIWREAFLLRPKFNATLHFWAGSWRRTYALHHLRLSQEQRLPSSPWLRGLSEPVTTPDMFSDHLFHSFIHALTPLGPLLPHQDDQKHSRFNKIDRISSSQYTVATFTQSYSRPNRPCIITDEPGLRPGTVNRWPCADWTLDTLAHQWPDRIFRAEAIKCSSKTYLSYARSCGAHALRAKGDRVRIGYFPPPTKLSVGSEKGTGDLKIAAFDPYVIPDESPFYLFDASFPATDATAASSWRIPELLATGPSGSSTEVDLFALFGPQQRPDYRWLIAGPERSGSGWHLDPNGTSAWNTVLSGSKLWLMLPPGTPPPGVYVSQDEGEVTSPASLAEWVSLFAKATYEVHGTGKGGDGKLLVGVCHAGETCYVPSGWWHAVLNLEECVALTQNFVSPVELPYVLHFLKHKHDQISGFKRPPDNFSNSTGGADIDADADDEEAAAASATGPRHQQTRGANGTSNGEERDFRLDIFDTFCKRLHEYDSALLQKGLAGMQAIEQQRALERAHVQTAQINNLGRKRATNGEDATHVTWWERLKSGSEASDPGQVTASEHPNADRYYHPSTFALGASIDDEELEEVPW